MAGFLESLLKDNTYTAFAEEISKDKENLKKLRKEFAKALTETGKMEAETHSDSTRAAAQTEDVKFSKKLGGYFPDIRISTETVKNIGIKNINNVGEVIDKVCKCLEGDFLSIGEDAKPIENIDTGMQIYVYRKGINETFGKKEFYKDLSDEWKKVKIAVALELDEIIKYGEVRANEAENMHKQNSDTKFAYLTAPVTVDGKKVTVDIDIRRTNRGDRFYMHKIKIADSSSRAAVKRPKSKAELSASDASLAQKQDEGNRKFSLSKTVEETENLIAVHNLSADNLNRVLDLGGFAMPSIAIVKDDMEHSKYGDISVVFGKETIDPEMDGRNAVYGGDAWTPTIPGVNYAVNKKKKEEFESEIENLASKILNGTFAQSSLFGSMGIDEWTDNTQWQIAHRLADRDAVMAAYAADQGIVVELAYHEKKYDQ